MESNNPFFFVQKQVARSANILGLDEAIIKKLQTPQQELSSSLKIKMDNNTTKSFLAFRIQHNRALGPTKGGIRFHPEETIDTVRALASWMTWKCSLLGLPLGGAKGGVICNPKELSQAELEKLSRAYMAAFYENIGPSKDVPAPDVGTNQQVMAWMADEYEKLAGRPGLGVITGKPVNKGGSLGREDATGRGGIYVLREAAKTASLNMEGASIAIQGFGNVGYYAAKLAVSILGVKVVAVSGSRGGIYNDEGLDVEAAYEYKKENSSFDNCPLGQAVSNDELLGLEVDVLIPAALENAITKDNVNNIKAKIVLELANGPTTPEADKILQEKNIMVVPDFLSNAGGVVVSYFEMQQNKNDQYWSVEEVHERLSEKMLKAYQSTVKTAREHKISLRQAAYVIAIKRVASAMN